MNVLNKLKKTSASALALLTIMFFGLSAAIYAITDAGEVITNIASVDYEDENGNSYTATSNEAEVTVGTVFGSTIEQDRLDIVAAPGQTVYIPYVLTNIGNDTDTYTVGLANEDGLSAGTAENLESIANGGAADENGTGLDIYEDTNGNGQPDAGEPIVTSTSVEIDAGLTINLVAAVTVPSSLSADDVIGVILTADSDNTFELTDDLTASNGQDTNEGTVQGLITVSTGAVLVPTKSSSINTAGTEITYTLTVKNNGGDAQDVDIFDAIPAGTTFQAGSLSVSGLLDRAGIGSDDLQYEDANLAVDQVTVLGANLGANDNEINLSAPPFTLTNDFGEPAGIDMDGDGIPGEAAGDNNGLPGGGGSDGTDDVIGFLLRDVSLENGVTVSVTYTVDINSGLAAGTQIKNTFCVGENLAGIDETGAANAGALDPGTAIDDAICSNTAIDVVPQLYAVVADDTDGNGDNTTIDNDNGPVIGNDEDKINQDGAAGEAIQHEISASVGETIDLRNVITNNGNGSDNFDLSIAVSGNTFPDGTLFTFWDATGSVPLTDDSGNGVPDTGSIDAGDSVTVTVRAQLPSTIPATGGVGDTIGNTVGITFANNQYFIDRGAPNGTWDDSDGIDNVFDTADDERFEAILTATSVGSVNDANVSTVSDTKAESLGVIVAAGVDLANGVFTSGGDVQSATAGTINLYAEAGDVGGNISAVDVNETTVGGDAADPDDTIANLNSSVQNVHGKDDPAVDGGSALGAEDARDFSTTYTVGVGQTFRVDLLVSNEAGSPDAFTLGFRSFGTTIASSAQVLTGFNTAAPAGWNVVFRDRTSDAIISSTPSIPGGSVYSYYADITVSSDGAQALDGTDYYFAFSVNSSANSDSDPYDTTVDGVSDVKVDLIQISPFCAISIIPNGSEQVQPGGTEDFAHTLSNDGNSDKSFDLRTYVDTDDSGTDDDSWTSTLFVDTDDDDLPDTALSLALSGGSNVCYYNASSLRVCDTSRISAVVTAGDANITLQPGAQILIWNRVFAPATASNGFIQTSTVEAAGTGDTITDCAPSTITATDTATVILGQIRLEKTVAVDDTCECDGQDNTNVDLTFDEISATDVEPGQCVVWRLIAENEGDVAADSVVINDAITQFSVLASSGVYGANNPSSTTIAQPAATEVIQLCASEVAVAGGGSDCTAQVNLVDQTVTALDDAVDFAAGTGSLTFRVGVPQAPETDLTSEGGRLVPGDRAIAQFCVQVE